MSKTKTDPCGDALFKFQKQYPSGTSGDLQTFILGWYACEEHFKNLMEEHGKISNVISDMYNQEHEDIERLAKSVDKIKAKERKIR